MPHILLTGAGFSRNWGGWLADEAFEYLLGCPRVSNELLWRYKGSGGFEAAYDELQTESAKPGRSVALLNEATDFDAAIRGMFADMNEAFAEMGKLNFIGHINSVTEFLDKFDAIFTLNQDLLLERQYKSDSDNLSMMLAPRLWYMPGMVPSTQARGTPVQHVKEWRPIEPFDPSKFNYDISDQPYFKLHGSSNWVDRRSGQPVLVIGGNKPSAIARHPILKWNHEKFREYLWRRDTRLMIIGYSFGDRHINNAIGEAANRGGSLRVFIIDPRGADILERRGRGFYLSGDFFVGLRGHLIGASRRPLSQIFGGDVVEHRKVMRFFD